jgi:YidC/Oxa1 family membrane protein insertase
MSSLFHLFIYDPLYNGLIFLISILPHKDVGVAVILFTALVKLVLFPLSKSSLVTQIKLRTLEPEIKSLREKYKDKKEEQARKLMEFYRNNKINPFSSFFLAILQIPIILALYFIFFSGGLPNVNPELLYSFIKAPTDINMDFLGLIDIAKASAILGAIAGITQFLQAKLSVPPIKKKTDGSKNSFSEDFTNSMNIQMKYVLPIIIFLFSLKVSGAVALYWITGNLFTIGQELYLRKKKLK